MFFREESCRTEIFIFFTWGLNHTQWKEVMHHLAECFHFAQVIEQWCTDYTIHYVLNS